MESVSFVGEFVRPQRRSGCGGVHVVVLRGRVGVGRRVDVWFGVVVPFSVFVVVVNVVESFPGRLDGLVVDFGDIVRFFGWGDVVFSVGGLIRGGFWVGWDDSLVGGVIDFIWLWLWLWLLLFLFRFLHLIIVAGRIRLIHDGFRFLCIIMIIISASLSLCLCQERHIFRCLSFHVFFFFTCHWFHFLGFLIIPHLGLLFVFVTFPNVVSRFGGIQFDRRSGNRFEFRGKGIGIVIHIFFFFFFFGGGATATSSKLSSTFSSGISSTSTKFPFLFSAALAANSS
mmetsp:Transcript_15112/g.30823  ORF Transcript_15112/g.30823 Transcript_15112/m.30823 type:complete len:284 (-) Transcript_15112:2362-3213(-)